MKFISDVLFWISDGLLVPVIVLLILLFVRALLLLIGFFGQYLTSSKTASAVNKELKALDRSNIGSLSGRLPESGTPVVRYIRMMLDNPGNAPARHKLMSDFEADADKDLSVSKTLTKLGPMLGLMGRLFRWALPWSDFLPEISHLWLTTCRWPSPRLWWDFFRAPSASSPSRSSKDGT